MKRYLGPLILALAGIALPLIGAQFSYVAKNGMVHEPFFFTVPLGEAMLAAAVVWAVVTAWRRRRSK
ncbi:DUF3955 domain-containing protein [Lacticaseibacillus suihuaensis]